MKFYVSQLPALLLCLQTKNNTYAPNPYWDANVDLLIRVARRIPIRTIVDSTSFVILYACQR